MTKLFLQQVEAETVTIAGGTGAVGEAVERELVEMGISVARRAGVSRAITAAQLSAFRFANPRGVGAIWVDGAGADAWAAGLPAVLMAQRGRSYILLTLGDVVPSVTADLTWGVAGTNRLICAPFVPATACGEGDAVAHVDTAQSGPAYAADLNGASEVPGPGHPSARANADIREVVGRMRPVGPADVLCYRYVIEQGAIVPLSGAHIHRGARGQSGPPVVTLTTDTTPLHADGPPQAVGCASASAALLDEIRADPQGFYVNLHTAEHPQGAVRGQLVAAVS